MAKSHIFSLRAQIRCFSDKTRHALQRCIVFFALGAFLKKSIFYRLTPALDMKIRVCRKKVAETDQKHLFYHFISFSEKFVDSGAARPYKIVDSYRHSVLIGC